ncbi:MAG TPA: thioredoxin domain-containing protein [Cyclobacteriaceae bacterium]|nr:thioredoxin domain-containing protein [Cyclobacteriaceae bacterium]
MKRFTLLSLIILAALTLSAQGWISDFKMAQNLAKNSNKLILVDFWATWCGPCKQMDAEVWSTAEAAEIKKNFIPVKIDVDVERTLANQYSVQSIPLLILMDYKGENIYSYTGYRGKVDLMNFIKGIPSNSVNLFQQLEKIEAKKDEDYQSTKELGIAYQILSGMADYGPLQRSLLSKSEMWFKKANKLSSTDIEKNEMDLLSALNAVYRNSYKKPLADIESNKAKYENSSNEALMYYVLAQAYKKSGDDENYKLAIAGLERTDPSRKYLSRTE